MRQGPVPCGHSIEPEGIDKWQDSLSILSVAHQRMLNGVPVVTQPFDSPIYGFQPLFSGQAGNGQKIVGRNRLADVVRAGKKPGIDAVMETNSTTGPLSISNWTSVPGGHPLNDSISSA